MIRKLVTGFVTITIGYWVWTGILFGLLAIVQLLSIVKIISITDLYSQSWYKIVLGLVLLAGFIGSIVFSLRARRNKNTLYEIFKPTKEKWLVNLVIFGILVGITFLLTKGRLDFIDTSNFTLFDWRSNIPLTIAAIIAAYTYVYPFSAALWSFKQSFNKGNKKLYANRLLTVILIVLLNPLTQCMGIIHLASYRYSEDIKSNKLNQCGARVSQVNSGGAAEKAGMQAFEVIYKVDDKQIQSPNELVDFLNQLNTAKPVAVQTQLKTYTITPKLDSQSGKYRLGVGVDKGYCKKE